jgi:hypothetical protein
MVPGTPNDLTKESRMSHHDHSHDHAHDHDHEHSENLVEEQSQIAREIGEELTDAFVAFVRGDVAFDDLVFGVFDALNDLHVIASGEYELEEVDDEDVEDEDESDADADDDK